MSPRWRGKVDPESGKEFNILLNTAEIACFVCYYSFKHNMTLTLASLLQKNDPIELWKAFKTHAPFSELSEFAITLLEIVVNQAGCEWLFLDLTVKQAARRNQLSIPKLEKMTKVSICLSLIIFFE